MASATCLRYASTRSPPAAGSLNSGVGTLGDGSIPGTESHALASSRSIQPTFRAFRYCIWRKTSTNLTWNYWTFEISGTMTCGAGTPSPKPCGAGTYMDPTRPDSQALLVLFLAAPHVLGIAARDATATALPGTLLRLSQVVTLLESVAKHFIRRRAKARQRKWRQ